MSKMTIKVHEAKEIPDALKGIVDNALDYELCGDRCVTFEKSAKRPSSFVAALYDMDGNLLDSEDTTVYHAACYYRGTLEDCMKNKGVEGLTFYRD